MNNERVNCAIRRLTIVLAFVTAVYHIAYVFWFPWGTTTHTILHLGAALLLVLLPKAFEEQGFRRVVSVLALLLASITIPFFLIMSDTLEMKYGMGLNTLEFAMGLAVIATTVLAVYLAWGLAIPVVCVLFLTYFFFGYMIPGPMQAARMPTADYAMAFLAAGGSSGIFAGVTNVSANYIFLFVLFGAVFGATGVLSMFIEVGRYFGQLVRGGAAFTAIVGSALMGSVTGATVANVALTGSVTIPTMKKQGYRSTDAVAIESVASCGGQVLPPIMGTGAILMASFLGMPYVSILAMAMVPAMLFFAGLLITALVVARNRPIALDEEPIDWALVRGHLAHFVIPVGLVIYLLLIGRSPEIAIVWALIAGIALFLLRPSNLTSWRQMWCSIKSLCVGLVQGARQAAEIAVVLAAIAVVAQALITTAAAPKLALMMRAFAGDIPLLWLIMSMVTCIILGFGMPTAAAYTLVAIMMVPAMSQFGLEPHVAHFFIFYYAVYAAVTPPVATAVIVGSKIAQVGFWPAAWASVKFMIVPLLLPFAFVYHPELLAFPNVTLALLMPALALLVAAFHGSVLLYGGLDGRYDALTVAMTGVGFVTAVLWIFLSMPSLLIISTALAIGGMLLQTYRSQPMQKAVA